MKNIFTKTAVAVGAVIIGLTSVALPAFGQQVYYGSYNTPPIWDEIANTSVAQGNTLSLVVRAQDNNNDSLTYSGVRLPDNASFNPATRAFFFSPQYNQTGTFPVTLGVTDNKSAPVYKTFYVSVYTDYNRVNYPYNDPNYSYNSAPYFSSTRSYYAVQSNQQFEFTVKAIDPENSSVYYTVTNLPIGATFDQERGIFRWTPSQAQRGTQSLQFFASDGFMNSPAFMVTIVVDADQNYSGNFGYGYNNGVYNSYYPGAYNYSTYGQPYFTSVAPTSARAGETYIYDAVAFDSDRDQLNYQLVSAPVGAVINQSTGRIVWVVPASAYSGQSYQFTVTAADGRTTPATQSFTVTISGAAATNIVYYPSSASEIKYVYRDATPTVKYVTASPVQNTTVANSNYYPGQAIVINAGRTVPTYPVSSYAVSGATANYASYDTYTGSAYGASAFRSFNLAVRVQPKGDLMVSWDTSKPSRGEVVYGYSSNPRSDSWNTILNYDFTTGEQSSPSTKHELSLGKLEIGRTYYMRAISRTGSETDISREIIFIPMQTAQGTPSVQQYDGAASAIDSAGSFLTSTGFLIILGLVAIALLLYIIYRFFAGRRPQEEYLPELHMSENGSNGNQ